jgi:hypothetical protein
MIGPMSERESTPEAAHDVLAAEAFAVPARDPELHHHGPISLPEDPTGDPEPHDVLAAEEFPMPAPRPHPADALAERRGGFGRLAFEVAAGLALVALAVRFFRRR